MNTFKFTAIGTVTSCYKEKFGIPRQPNLVKDARAELYLNGEYTEETLRGLEGFSHLWISFVFHATLEQGWKPMVRPPRLGGNAKVGVFASRSTFRPNPIGLSVVEYLGSDIQDSQLVLKLGGCDLLDGTPVLDIKPYLPYADTIPDAKGGFAPTKPEKMVEVSFSAEAQVQSSQAEQRLAQPLARMIEQILQLDPRPSYQQQQAPRNKIYAMRLFDFDLKWQYCENGTIEVIALERL